MMSPDTNIKIHHKFNYPENNFMQFLLFSIRKIYSELDFPCYLFKQNCISLAELNQSLYSKQTDLDFWRFEKDFNLKFQRFKKRLTILKKNYSNASQNVIFGRIGELVAYISFSRHKKRDFSLFKKMISKKFESGIDLFVIHKMRNNSSFYYHFYEVKCSCTNSIGNSVNKINNWYTYQNFSQKFVMERDAIIENIQNQQCYNKSQKKKIEDDLNNLERNILDNEIPSLNFYFNSFILVNEIKENPKLNVKKDKLFQNGIDYVIEVKNLKNIIKRCYECLNIVVLAN